MRRWLLVVTAVAVFPSLALGSTRPALVRDTVVHAGTGVGEPEVALDPHHPSDVVVGENNTGVSVSHDGGRSWAQVSLPNQGDNALTVDSLGTYYYTSLDGEVDVSHDRGQHWAATGNWVSELSAAWSGHAPDALKGAPFRFLGCNAPAPIGFVDPVRGPGFQVIGCDRPWLTADATIPARLYLAFIDHSDGSGGQPVSTAGCKTSTATNQVFTCGRQYVSTSRDGGATWSAFDPTDSLDAPAAWTNGFAGAPRGRDGVLASAYLAGAFPDSSCTTCVVLATSHDNGVTWSRHLVPLQVDGPGLGAHALNPLGVNASVAFEPFLAQDPSRRGRYAVMVFDRSQTHLLVVVTRDGGRSWSPPARLGEPGGTQAWLPWIAYGPNGALGAVWRRTYPDGSYAVWAAVSPAGGTTFARPVRLSSGASPGPVTQVAADDASFVVLDRQGLDAVWGDRRGGSLGIRYARYDFADDPAVRRLR